MIFKSQGIFEVLSGEKKFDKLKEEKEKAECKNLDALALKIIVTSVSKKYLIHILNDETSHGSLCIQNYVVT